MTKNTASTRRSFLKGGAMLAAPLAAAAVPVVAMADNQLEARLARLENETAIRELHQTWLRRVNTQAYDAAASLFADPTAAAFDRSLRRIAADHAGQPDAIEVAADSQRATGRFDCTVEIENAIAQDCTLARMAHAQGGGFVRRMERRVLHAQYVRDSGAWVIAQIRFAIQRPDGEAS